MVLSVGLQDMIDLVGGHARRAEPADAIDAVQPGIVVEPGSIEEACAVLKLAHDHDLALVARGSGTKLAWGNPPERLDVMVSTRRLNRVLEHAAGDLVVRTEAGVLLHEVQRTLHQSNQWLALDPPEAGATVGGIVAANAYGPHRLRFGTARDLLIGITYILPDGTLARAGGKVVKNVAGYDLCKLFTGSFGTLGLIVEAIFRLHPMPVTSRTVLWRGENLRFAVSALLDALLVPVAMDFTCDGDGYTLATRFEGIEPGVVAQAENACRILAQGATTLGGEEEQAWWRPASGPAWDEDSVDLVVGHPITALPEVLETLDSAGARKVRGHAGSGLTFATLPAHLPDCARAVEELRERIGNLEGSVVVRAAPPHIKQAVDLWGIESKAGALMRRVKEQFDPAGIMSPGRLVRSAPG